MNNNKNSCGCSTLSSAVIISIIIAIFPAIIPIAAVVVIGGFVTRFIRKRAMFKRYESISSSILPDEDFKKTNVRQELQNVDNMTDGYSFENYCCTLLKYNGFKKAETTKASGDYGVDIVAVHYNGKKYAVQCKCYTYNVDNSAVQQVVAGMKYYGCDIGVVLTNSYFTENATILAKANNILLWDRNKLTEMISIMLKQNRKKKKIYYGN